MATEGKLRTNYRLEMEALSPLHIGAGKGNLIFDYDYVGHRGMIWVIDQDKMLDRIGEEELLRAGSVVPRISRLLQPHQYAAHARYQLPLTGEVPPEIVPFVKDVHLRPYLPGSSLKGALRTAIAWAAYGDGGARLDTRDLPGDRRYADNRLEGRLFGRDPNHDVLRALQVGDSAGPEDGGLGMATVVLYTLRGAGLQPKGPGYQWRLEVLTPGARLTASLGVDEFLLGPKARELGFAGKEGMIKQLAAHAKAQARSIIAHEAEFYRTSGLPRLRQFYEGLGEATSGLGEDEFLLQIAWGTGWRAKTLGSRLEEDGAIQQVRDVYRLGRPEAPFPKTRRLVERGGVPELPLGWLKARIV